MAFNAQPFRTAVVVILLVIVVVLSMLALKKEESTPQPIQTITTPVSLALVQLHNSSSDCWTIIDGEVYDVSSYVKMHPGGEKEILKACGIDASELFAKKGGSGQHSTFARDLLKQFRINTGTTGSTNVTQDTKDTTTIPDVLKRALTLYPNADILGYTMFIEQDGKTYTITYKEGMFVVLDGIKNETAPSTQTSTTPTKPNCKIKEDVAKHTSKSSCWLIINNKVYDVTEFISAHPGGQQDIINNCGTDATNAFNTKGGEGSHSEFARGLLDDYFISTICSAEEEKVLVNTTEQVQPVTNTSIPFKVTIISPSLQQQFPVGTTSVTLQATTNQAATCRWGTTQQTSTTLFSTTGSKTHSTQVTGITDGSTKTVHISCQDTTNTLATATTTFSVQSPPQTTTTITMETLLTHNSQASCWLLINNNVYDVTNYISAHPGGQQRIISNCGKESTIAFDTRGGSGSHSTYARNLLAGFLVGPLGGTTTTPTSSPPQNTTTGSTGSVEQAIQAQFPGAVITDINNEDDGRSEVKFTYQGESYQAKLNSQNIITEVES